MHYIIGTGKSLLNAENNKGDTPLHFAAEVLNRRASIILVMAGHDHLKKNGKGFIPGDDGKIEIKMFNRKVFGENKAFGVLDDNQKATLTEIFNEIDLDNSKSINREKCCKFNMW